MQKTVFLVNDDGYLAPGINTIRDFLLEKGFRVIAVAPDRNMSGSSHSLTFTRPLKIEKYKEDFYYVVDGTPADCVHLGYFVVLKQQKPDILISGINMGPNLGNDIFYSGTVGAAREGTLFEIPSIAISPSSSKNVNFQEIAEGTYPIIQAILEKGLPKGTFLNVNYPVQRPVKGYKLTRQGRGAYEEEVKEYISPSGELYYWIGGKENLNAQCEEGTDYTAVKEGYVSITPVGIDLTNYEALRQLEEQNFLDFANKG